MLQSIREKTSGWVAGIILFFIAFTMLFFGMESYLRPAIETYVVKIEGPAKFWFFGKQSREISQGDFLKRFEQARQQQRQTLGDEFRAADFEKTENKRLVLDQLIDETLLLLAAERDGVVLPSSVIQKAIMEIEDFQVNGKFDKTRYQLALQSQNMTPEQFQVIVHDQLIQQTLPRELTASAFASDAELDAYLRLSRQTRDIRFLDIPPPKNDLVVPADSELKAWYDTHAKQYRSPEKVAVEYVELNAADLPVRATVDDATLRERYEAEKTRFGIAEQRLASHILIAVDEKASPAQINTALTKAKNLAAKARAPGSDFAALARQYSDDLGSKETGGDLGAVEKGTFGDAFDKAFFALTPGQISDPVRLPDGWHVILFRELQAGSLKPFEVVRAELEAEYLEGERERQFNDISAQLVDKVYADPNALAPAAAALKLTVQRTGLFTQSQGEGIAALEAVRQAAFSDEQKLERQVSDRIEISPTHSVVLQVIEHQPAAAIPFEKVRARVVSDVLADRAAKATKARADTFLARANKGESLDALAAELGQEVVDLPKINRNAPSPMLQPLVTEAFRLSKPVNGKSSVGLAKLSPSRYVLVTVSALYQGDLSGLDVDMRARLREQLAQARGSVDARSFIRALRKYYTVTIAEDRL